MYSKVWCIAAVALLTPICFANETSLIEKLVVRHLAIFEDLICPLLCMQDLKNMRCVNKDICNRLSSLGCFSSLFINMSLLDKKNLKDFKPLNYIQTIIAFPIKKTSNIAFLIHQPKLRYLLLEGLYLENAQECRNFFNILLQLKHLEEIEIHANQLTEDFVLGAVCLCVSVGIKKAFLFFQDGEERDFDSIVEKFSSFHFLEEFLLDVEKLSSSTKSDLFHKHVRYLKQNDSYSNKLNLQDFIVSQAAFTNFSEFINQMPNFDFIKKLDLSKNNISDTMIKKLAPLVVKVISLYLANNDIQNSGLVELSYLLKKNNLLEELDCSNNNFSAVGVQRLCENLNHLSTLKHLNLSFNNLEKAGLESIDSYLPLAALTELRLRNINVAHDSLKILSKIILKAQNLERVDVQKNILYTEKDILEWMESLQELKSLKEISFGCIELRELNQVTFMQQLSQINSLKELDFSENYGFFFHPKPIFFESIAFLNLECLDMSNNDLCCEHLMFFCSALEKSKKILNLRYLDISNSSLHVKGVFFLIKSFQYLKNIEFLNLSKSFFGEKNMKKIILSLDSLSKIRCLNLSSDENSFKNRMSCDSIKDLTSVILKLKYLNKIDIKNVKPKNDQWFICQAFKHLKKNMLKKINWICWDY